MINIIDSGASIAAVVLSLIAVYFTARTYFQSLAKVNLKPAGKDSICFCEPDRLSETKPDRFWNAKYRFICDLIIENQSSKPISIEDVVLDNEFNLMAYTDNAATYQITLQKFIPNIQKQITRNYHTEGNELKPVTNLQPYSSIRRIAIFNIGDNESFSNGVHSLKIISSRGAFIFKVIVSASLRTRLLPEEQFQSNLPRHFDDSNWTTPQPYQRDDTHE